MARRRRCATAGWSCRTIPCASSRSWKRGRDAVSGMAAVVERYRRDGFVHVPGLLPAAEMPALAAAVDAAVARRKALDPRALGEKTLYEQSFIQCQYLWEDFPGVRPLMFHPALGEA